MEKLKENTTNEAQKLKEEKDKFEEYKKSLREREKEIIKNETNNREILKQITKANSNLAS